MKPVPLLSLCWSNGQVIPLFPFPFPLFPRLVNISVNNMAFPFATRRFAAWLQFLSCVVLLSLLIGFRAVNVDLIFGWLTLGFLVAISALVVRARWKHRSQQGSAEGKPDSADVILRRIRRWWMDEKKA